MPRFIEISFIPLLKSAYPDETHFVNTQFSWEDGRGHISASSPLMSRFARLGSELWSAISISKNTGVEAVLVRARGSENSRSSLIIYFLKRSIGWALHFVAIRLAKKHHCKLVVVDRADETSIHPNDRRILEKCDIYFKREIPWSRWALFDQLKSKSICIGTVSSIRKFKLAEKKVLPLSLGIEDEIIASMPSLSAVPVHDIFYSGKSYDLARRTMVERDLADLKSEGLKIYIPTQTLTRDLFLQAIRESRMAISPGGVGWDCFRHYEVAACGSALILERPCIQAYEPPRDNEEAVYYEPGKSIKPLIQELLSSFRYERVAAGGKHWVLKNHTYSALGRHIEKILHPH